MILDRNGPEGIPSGLWEASEEVRKLNDPGVGMYLWITNKGEARGAGPWGYACNDVYHKNLVLIRGPSVVNSIVNTAEVNVYNTAIFSSLVKFIHIFPLIYS